MPFGMWTQVGQRNYVLDGGPYPSREGTLLRGMTSGFSCIPSTSVPTGRQQKQSNVTLDFPSEKSPFNAACPQNSSTTCYLIVIFNCRMLSSHVYLVSIDRPLTEEQLIKFGKIRVRVSALWWKYALFIPSVV